MANTTPHTPQSRRAAHRPRPNQRSTSRAHGRMPVPGLSLDAAKGILVAVALGLLLWAGMLLAVLWIVGVVR